MAGSNPAQPVGDLVGMRDSLEELKAELVGAPGLQHGLQCVSSHFGAVRRVAGDGNCFYRAFLFAYVETLSERLAAGDPSGSAERSRVTAVVMDSRARLIEAGYDELAFEAFYDMFVELLEALPKSAEAWRSSFLADNCADYYTWFMRLLTSCSLKMHSAKFEPFIDGADMSEFCRREVEPMGVECDHVQIAALTEFLSIRVNIMYLDNRLRSDAYSDPVVVEFPQVQEDGAHSDIISCFPPVNLLYRPGHYDILYYSK